MIRTLPRRRARGVALITVMFIMALLTTLVVYLVEDENLSIRRVSNQQDSEQGFDVAVYAEQWAQKTLEKDVSSSHTDYLGEDWNTKAPALASTDSAKLHTEILDLQGRFNLNNLAVGKDKVWYPAFQRLLSLLNLDPGLADAVVDWVDADINESGHDGAEDPEYLLKNPPYRAANRLMAGVGELAWVQGMTPKTIRILAPFVTALPRTGVRINVNTAPAQLLRILTKNILGEASAASLVSGRGDKGYQSVDAFLARTELAGMSDQVQPLVSVSSEYFQVYSRVNYGRYATVLYSTIERSPDTRQAVVIRRRRGVS
ncbi:MAG: type II secretion system minor pseudopilin GspK [Arenicellales bacterium]